MPSFQQFRERIRSCEKVRTAARVALAAALLNLANPAPIAVEPPTPTATRTNLKIVLENSPPEPVQISAKIDVPKLEQTQKIPQKSKKEKKKKREKNHKIKKIVREAARAEGVDPDFLLIVAEIESSLDPRAVSPKGALGLLQLMPAKIKELGVADPFDAGQNARGGAQLLSELIEKYGEEHALIAYLHGENALRKFLASGKFPKTAQRYLAKFRQIKAEREKSG